MSIEIIEVSVCMRAPLRATVENGKMTRGQGGNINKRII